MKLLLAILLLSAGSQAFAQEVEMKYGGEFRVRYQNHRNTTAQETDSVTNQDADRSDTDHRFKLNLTARKGESLQAGLTLLHASGWGRDNDPNAPATPSGGGSGTGVPSSRDEFGAENGIFVNRAWGWWKANDSISFKFGRLGFEFGDGSVFSENDWEQFPVSHDGVLGLWDINLGKFTFFGIKNRELGAGTLSSDAEENMYGFAFDFKNVPAFIKVMNFHFLQITQDETLVAGAATRDNRQHLGFSVSGDTFGLLYKASGAYQLGKTKGNVAGTPFSGNNNAWMYDVLAGYQMPTILNLKLTANYHQDSGDKNTTDLTKNEAYNTLFYDRHSFAGLMDVLRWGNLTYYALSASMTPMDDLDAGVSYLSFSRTAVGANSSATTFGPYYGITNDPTYKDLGNEVDAWVNKIYSNSGFQIGGRFGAFMPGESIRNVAVSPRRDKTVYLWFLQGAIVF